MDSDDLHQAFDAASKSLVTLLMALGILLARALSALFVLVRLALPVGAAALQGIGAVLLFGSVVVAYGGDIPALLLALASVVIVPVALMLGARGAVNIWGILIASGVLSLLAHVAIARSPPILLGVLPGIGLSACVFYLAFGSKSGAPDSESEARDGK